MWESLLNQAGFYQMGPCFFLGSRVGSNDGVQCIAPLWLRPSKRKRSLIPARRHTKNTWKRDMIGFNIPKFLGYTLHPVKVDKQYLCIIHFLMKGPILAFTFHRYRVGGLPKKFPCWAKCRSVTFFLGHNSMLVQDEIPRMSKILLL